LTVNRLDKLERPVLLVAIFHFAACAFEGLDKEDLEAFGQTLKQSYSEAE